MPVHLNISNSLTQLASTLCIDLRQTPGNVFQPQYIVTQTEGMNNWLKLQIAEQNGIAANCLFVSPNEIIQKLYYILGGRFPNMLSAQNLGWLLYAILGEKNFTVRFPDVASYYSNDHFDKDLKRMALAEKTADLFDQYQVYRPEWIAAWDNEKLDELAAGKWQEYLWVRAKELSGDRLPDKTVVGRYIKEALADQGKRETLKAKMPVLHLFGLSITTDYHLELLFEVAQTAHVHFYLLNPAPSVYWFEDRSEKHLAILQRKGLADKSENNPVNPLLTSWGRVIQDTFMMLFRNEELLNSYQEVGLTEPRPDNLLHKIQNDIYNGASKEDRNIISLSDLGDRSLNISSCFTIAREVEVLYNYLVHLVDQKKESLSPKNIVVMVTDIDAYAPYIKAVFKNAPHLFHFTIADETFVNGDTLVSALTALLKMNRRNCKAEEVLQLLDSGFIRKRFGITDPDLIRKVVNGANIRFGMEGKMEDDTRMVSWQYGLKRIMYGICISGSEEYADKEGELLYPLDMVEGGDSQQVIRFCHFVQVLMESINERERTRTIAEWVDYIDSVIQNMVCEPEEETGEDYALLQAQLKSFNIADEYMKEKIAFDVFSHSLLHSISGAGRSGSFAGGGITFCSLIPMRSIPFKVVALLGLNFDKFPRKEPVASFNLIEKDKRRRGDRKVKENDRHLFLETLVSAKDYLYISYLGQSAKENTTIPPSALVDELIDYIAASCEEPEKVRPALVIRHPLQSFSKKYSGSLPDYYNYLDTKRSAVEKIIDKNKMTGSFKFDEISMEGLISFVKHPFKAYYHKVLDIYYRDDQVLLRDTELFELDSLQKWKLKSNLVTLDEEDISGLKKRLVKTGGLPLKNMGGVAIEKLEDEVDKTRKLFQGCIEGLAAKKIFIELSIANSVFTGFLTNIYDRKLVFVSYSKRETRHLLDAYVKSLTAFAFGLDVDPYFISTSKQDVFRGTPVAQDEAMRRLNELVELYKEGHHHLVDFFADLEIKPDDVDTLNETDFAKAVKNFFTNSLNPSDDPYLLNAYKDEYFESEGIVERYKANAVKLLKPLKQMFPGYFD